ncbi:MAG: hypothetical protein ACT4PJ_09235 [Gemmatimonadaceae bacterium]
MPRRLRLPDEPALRAALLRGVDAPPPEDTARLAAFLARAFGPTTAAVIHYGSRVHSSDARPESAHDFFVIVDRYADAYARLSATVRPGYSPRTATALAHVLPPNVVSLTLSQGNRSLRAKCAVLSLRDLRRLTSRRAPDHFTRGRLFQHVQLVWTRDARSRQEALEALLDARVGTFEWSQPYLPSVFNAESYCRRLLETSFAAEIRPEGGERIAALIAAQREVVLPVYDSLLQWLEVSRIVTKDGNVYHLTARAGRLRRVLSRLWFLKSKARATARWLKYVVLYEGWLEYIVQKIARRSGRTIELTERERRWPLIFLWPKVIEYVRTRPQVKAPRTEK